LINKATILPKKAPPKISIKKWTLAKILPDATVNAPKRKTNPNSGFNNKIETAKPNAEAVWEEGKEFPEGIVIVNGGYPFTLKGLIDGIILLIISDVNQANKVENITLNTISFLIFFLMP